MMEKDQWTPIRSLQQGPPQQGNWGQPGGGWPSSEPSDPNLWGDGYEDPHAESSLYDYWLIVYKFRILIAACTVGVTLLATLYAFLVTPLFTASSTIRIGTYEPILAANSVEGIYQEKSKEADYLATQIQQIKSFAVGDRALRDNEIRAVLDKPKEESFLSLLFGGSSSDEPGNRRDANLVYEHNVSLIEDYLGMVDVAPVRRTSLVEIHATAADPVLAARIANTHAREYREWLRESHVQQRSDTLQFLREQADELRQKVSGLEREIADYAEKHSIVAVNKDENITAQRMSQLSQLLTDVTAKRIEAENTYEKSKDLNAENSAAYDDSTTLNMRTELGRLRGEYGLLLQKFTPEYPQVKQLAGQIKELEAQVVEQREQIISGLRSKAIALQLEEDRLKEELEQQKSQTFELAKKQVEYNVMVRDLESSRELLQNVLRQTKESALAIEGNPSNVSLVDHAITPLEPSYPKKSLLLLAGFVAGIGIGVGLAFLLSHLDNTIRSPELLSQITGLPNLGLVPSFEQQAETLLIEEQGPDGKGDFGEASSDAPNRIIADSPDDGGGSKKDSSDALAPTVSSGTDLVDPQQIHPITFLRDPKSLASEAYRTIRTGILLSQAGEPPRSILVTSSHSSEGKTTSAVNLAASLSSSGGTVVLLDCDFRRPSLMRYFQIEQGMPGLVEVITGQAELEQVKVENLLKRITIIPPGKIPPNPAELIGSLEMKKILDSLREQYDFVVVDSPPILPVTDSVVLSRYVDGVVLVVKGGATPKRLVRDAVSRLKRVGTRVLGTILNDIDFQGADYHYYNRYYSAYYHSEENSTETVIDPVSRTESGSDSRKASGV